MNNGANIVYLGADELFRNPGDIRSTNKSNRTELQRTYSIRKDRKDDAIATLVPGFAAEDYSNLYLWLPPKLRLTETHAFFDCVFQGILDPLEGGNDPGFENLDVLSNIEPYLHDYSADLVYFVSPVNRYFYTVQAGSPDRSVTRVIPLPTTVPVRNNIASANGTDTVIVIGGNSIPIPALYNAPGSKFFWSQTELQRDNFGNYDEIIESWALKSKDQYDQ